MRADDPLVMPGETRWTLSRLVAVGLAGSYSLAAFFLDGAQAALVIGGSSLFPLVFIVFSDVLGEYTGMWGLRSITRPTPPRFLEVAGWFLLLLPLPFVAVEWLL